jgi:hypothetical protein
MTKSYEVKPREIQPAAPARANESDRAAAPVRSPVPAKRKRTAVRRRPTGRAKPIRRTT